MCDQQAPVRTGRAIRRAGYFHLRYASAKLDIDPSRGCMKSLFSESLGEVAAEAYALSGRLCGSCGDLHALWPYIRLSRSSTGSESEGSELELALRGLIGDGRPRILVAGSADSGLVALIARAGASHPEEVVVLDICETPLELCRQFANKWSMQIETRRQDLRELDDQSSFDLVLVHGTLHFISPDGRLEALTRIRRALRPQGRLVLMFNTSSPSTVEIDDNFHRGYADSVLGELKRLHIALPDSEATLRARLCAHSRRRQLREGAFAKAADVDLLLKEAGFEVTRCVQVGIKLAGTAQSFVSHISKRRFMLIARAMHDI
jgi:SAM-dependent methyltransferase